ncbi:hypothetical protein HK100_011565 [Physocladia obscura]|uniref:Uncharacterized protein n=1 Tax=Physocladia obscura TaxID=109957 RepID=A0AAD5T8I6_9FUNG|nr:hypothetical protein HK100_011565 [Physocladia obscura]
MDVLIAYAALGIMATVSIYTGSYAGLKNDRVVRDPYDSELDNKDDEDESEFFSFNDAKWYPIIGSVTLFSLYIILKYVSKDWINLFLTANFGIIGFFSTYEVVLSAVRLVSGHPLRGSFRLSLTRLRFSDKTRNFQHGTIHPPDKEISTLRFGFAHFFIAAIVLATTAAYLYYKHWILSNAFGISFSITAIRLLKLDSFATGMMLLAGLFFYDVFWVFGTDVMVTVAKGLDVPIKVIFPKNLTAVLEYGILNVPPKEVSGFTMLGLGDIVIPGIFVALCLSFDYTNWTQAKTAKQSSKQRRFPAPYFWMCFIMYIAGLATTVYVMHTFQAAQASPSSLIILVS